MLSFQIADNCSTLFHFTLGSKHAIHVKDAFAAHYILFIFMHHLLANLLAPALPSIRLDSWESSPVIAAHTGALDWAQSILINAFSQPIKNCALIPAYLPAVLHKLSEAVEGWNLSAIEQNWINCQHAWRRQRKALCVKCQSKWHGSKEYAHGTEAKHPKIERHLIRCWNSGRKM